MGAYLATIFHVKSEFQFKTKACVHISGTSLDEINAECSALHGHLPTYRTVKLAIIFARNFTS